MTPEKVKGQIQSNLGDQNFTEPGLEIYWMQLYDAIIRVVTKYSLDLDPFHHPTLTFHLSSWSPLYSPSSFTVLPFTVKASSWDAVTGPCKE